MTTRIRERLVDEVTVLDVSGRLTLGEGSSHLRDFVRHVVRRGDRWLLLNLGDVNFIDSSGVAELVRAFGTTKSEGGCLKLVNLVKRVKDLLIITRLYTLFESFNDEATAIRSFRGGFRYVHCPLCGRFRTGPPVENQSEFGPQKCILCDVEFLVERLAGQAGTVCVRRLRVPTYFDEYLQISTGKHYRMEVVGRLNRFSFSFLRAVWRKLPAPRRVLLVLGDATDLEDNAAAVVGDFAADHSRDDRAVIVLAGRHADWATAFWPVLPVSTDEAVALKSFSGLSEAPPWTIRVFEQ